MNGYNDDNGTNRGRIWFGIFMVIIYVGMGLLFILDVLNIDNKTISVIVGSILCVYGVWRGYRLYRGGR